MSTPNLKPGEMECRGCKKRIIMARNVDTGTVVPIDVRAVVYRVKQDETGAWIAKQMKGPAYQAGLNHYSNCDQAQKFNLRARAVRLKIGKLLEEAGQASLDGDPELAFDLIAKARALVESRGSK